MAEGNSSDDRDTVIVLRCTSEHDGKARGTTLRNDSSDINADRYRERFEWQ